MLAPMMIMLREGIEAALIVAIIASYLRKTGRTDLMRPMWIGVGAAAALCVAVGVAINATASELPHERQELLEAVIGFAAVGVLTWMVFWMRKVGRSIKGELEDKLDVALARPGANAGRALVAMAFFAVLREGFESVLFLLASFQQGGADALAGAVIGLAIAIGLGIALYKGSVRLNLRKFFTFTGAFIIVFAAGMLAASLHKLWEAGLWNYLQQPTWNTSSIVSESSNLGNVLRGLLHYDAAPNLGEVIVYWAYLIPTMIFFFAGSRSSKAPEGTPDRPPVAAESTTPAPDGAAAATTAAPAVPPGRAPSSPGPSSPAPSSPGPSSPGPSSPPSTLEAATPTS